MPTESSGNRFINDNRAAQADNLLVLPLSGNDLALTNNQLTLTYPANSITLLIVPRLYRTRLTYGFIYH